MERDSHSDDEIKEIFSLKNVAVVGMSKNQDKAAHYVPKYLSENGYQYNANKSYNRSNFR